jgi:hypothetical protein
MNKFVKAFFRGVALVDTAGLVKAHLDNDLPLFVLFFITVMLTAAVGWWEK